MPKKEEEQFAQDFEQLPEYVGEDVVVPKEQQQEEEIPQRPVKNRAHRRLEKALEASQQMNLELQEFIRKQKQGSETQNFQREANLDEDVHRMLFGSVAETPETRASALAVQRVLERQAKTAEERAYQRAFETFQQSQQTAQAEVEKNAAYLNDELEGIEDNYNVDLSGDTEQSRKVRNGFLDFVERLSRKDKEGNILDYPDIQSAWEEFSSRRERQTNVRNRQVASRSMSSSAGGDSADDSQKKAMEKFMLENGFI